METKIAPATTPLSGTSTPLGVTTTSLAATTPLRATSAATTPLVGSTSIGNARGISAPQNITGTTASAVQPKVEQTLAARFLGSSDGRSSRFSGLGDGRSSVRGQSDDTDLSRRILETHESDDRGLPVKPVLHIIDVIFYRATADLTGYIVVRQCLHISIIYIDMYMYMYMYVVIN